MKAPLIGILIGLLLIAGIGIPAVAQDFGEFHRGRDSLIRYLLSPDSVAYYAPYLAADSTFQVMTRGGDWQAFRSGRMISLDQPVVVTRWRRNGDAVGAITDTLLANVWLTWYFDTDSLKVDIGTATHVQIECDGW